MLITVDGQSSTGKSSLAAALASRLSYHFLGSGSIYRVLAYGILYEDVHIPDYVASMQREMAFSYRCGEMRVLYAGKDITSKINEAVVTKKASDIAKDPMVRKLLEPLQYQFNQSPGLVAEGRDMGTVIFPNAAVKFFLTADVNVRADRRLQQLGDMGVESDMSTVVSQLQIRDQQDESRDVAPLVAASDAIMIDTANAFEDTLEMMYQEVINKLPKSNIPEDLASYFEQLKQEAQIVAQKETNVRSWWQEEKQKVYKQFGGEEISAHWLLPIYKKGFDPYSVENHVVDKKRGLYALDELIRIPLSRPITPVRVMQVALNIALAKADGEISRDFSISDFMYFKA